jgi:hypothetical protein
LILLEKPKIEIGKYLSKHYRLWKFHERFFELLTGDIKNIWADKQTYLALGNLLNAAAGLNIDASHFGLLNSMQSWTN